MPVPNPEQIILEIAEELAQCKDYIEIQRTVGSRMRAFLWAKLQILGDLFQAKAPKSSEILAIARLAVGESSDAVSAADPTVLASDARMAMTMGLRTLDLCNQAFLCRFPEDPGKYAANPHFEKYVVGVLSIEMLQVAATLLVQSEIKARHKPCLTQLAYLMQNWSEELYSVAKALGFFVSPHIEPGPVPPADPDAFALAEAAWFESCKSLAAQE